MLSGPQPGHVYTFPSTELRAIDVEMQPVMPLAPPNVVANEARPVLGLSRLGLHVGRHNVQYKRFAILSTPHGSDKHHLRTTVVGDSTW